MRKEVAPPGAGFSSTATVPSALRSPAAFVALSKSAASASRDCRTLEYSPFLICPAKSCSGKCASLRLKEKSMAVLTRSSISLGKSGGPGRSMPQPNCRAFRAFSMFAIAGLPITGPVRLGCAPQLGRQIMTMICFTRMKNADECSHGFSCGIGRDDGCRSGSPSLSENAPPIILTDLCGTPDRARFWTTFSNITLFFVPFAFAPDHQPDAQLKQAAILQISGQSVLRKDSIYCSVAKQISSAPLMPSVGP
jgi:hypothetical protein